MTRLKSGKYCRSILFPVVFLLLLSACTPPVHDHTITTGTLIKEMVDLEGLTYFPDPSYRTVQFSSYDRQSTSPDEPGWFANSDGFGGEPVPGFVEVLKQRDENGTGEYLMCDVKGPGALVRLWTARITGDIRFYLDDLTKPLYEGPAQPFFINTYKTLKEDLPEDIFSGVFTQNVAGYYPIPFAGRCRIEWTGNTDHLHFYHIQFRLYEKGTRVKTFSPDDLAAYSDVMAETAGILKNPDEAWSEGKNEVRTGIDERIPPGKTGEILKLNGPGAVRTLSLSVEAGNMDNALRQNVLNISFDGASVSQVQSPVGDFFCTAPGINPYTSLPFTVNDDGRMTCRFIMPFRDSVKMEVHNYGKEEVHITGYALSCGYDWKEGKSMHLRARWRADHHLVASNHNPYDIPYLVAGGRGVLTGAAAMLMNPTSVPSSNGNWWGEGDEKIFVDNDTFPSFFGTGSEDYFNYAWSSADIFAHPYCGQPRNDGPGNRGYVTNYRWHIIDPIPFRERISFYMELLSHGPVPGFSYGRIMYHYGIPGICDDHIPLMKEDVQLPPLPEKWEPSGYRFCANAMFYQAEQLTGMNRHMLFMEDDLWAGGKLLAWKPVKENDELTLTLPIVSEGEYVILLTLCKSPGSGSFTAKMNGGEILLSKNRETDLYAPYGTLSRSVQAAPLKLTAGKHTITLFNTGKPDRFIGIDFVWIVKR